MKNKKKKIIYAIIFLIICVSILITNNVNAEEKGRSRVLFISSYSYTWPTVPLQISGIQSSLSKDVMLDIEFMDTKTINGHIAKPIETSILYKTLDSIFTGENN